MTMSRVVLMPVENVETSCGNGNGNVNCVHQCEIQCRSGLGNKRSVGFKSVAASWVESARLFVAARVENGLQVGELK